MNSGAPGLARFASSSTASAAVVAPSFAAATHGFWGTGVEEDAVAVLTDGGLIATLRVSHIRWVNTLRLEVSGDDGYAIGTGRGGTYGPQRVRFGRRWAWNDASGRAQRETERVLELGDDDRVVDRVRDEVSTGGRSLARHASAHFSTGHLSALAP